jgi:tetratricopeptide (TPR) repeat protein
VKRFVLAVIVALGAHVAPVCGLAAAAQDPAVALSRLEAAVAADPEDLRAASAYRMAAIEAGEHDRAVGFFEKLVAEHPDAANAWLNLGYAYVDKIPTAGSVTRVILANDAVTRFSKAIALRKSWLALYTRGNSYLYWPKVFGRAPLGVADLEEAVALARREEKKKPVYARSFVALGDGYWKTDRLAKAKAVWREGLQLFPGDRQLQARVDLASRSGRIGRIGRSGHSDNAEELAAYIEEQLDPGKRVDTDLLPLLEGD